MRMSAKRFSRGTAGCQVACENLALSGNEWKLACVAGHRCANNCSVRSRSSAAQVGIVPLTDSSEHRFG
jgi:hypothetical protein